MIVAMVIVFIVAAYALGDTLATVRFEKEMEAAFYRGLETGKGMQKLEDNDYCEHMCDCRVK